MKLWLAVVIAACGSSPSAPAPVTNKAPPSADAAPPKTFVETELDKMRELEAAMCRCHDAACTQKVVDGMRTFVAEDKRERARPDGPQLTDGQIESFTEIQKGMGKCMQAATAGASAPTP